MRNLLFQTDQGPMTFTDPWDLLDWLKQLNLRGLPITIRCWKYVPVDPEAPKRLDTRWYCQFDGGQWNTRVHILRRLTIDGVEFCVVQGATEAFSAPHRTAKGAVLLVPATEIFEEAQ